jgi:hypothetical protein
MLLRLIAPRLQSLCDRPTPIDLSIAQRPSDCWRSFIMPSEGRSLHPTLTMSDRPSPLWVLRSAHLAFHIAIAPPSLGLRSPPTPHNERSPPSSEPNRSPNGVSGVAIAPSVLGHSNPLKNLLEWSQVKVLSIVTRGYQLGRVMRPRRGDCACTRSKTCNVRTDFFHVGRK